MSNIYLA